MPCSEIEVLRSNQLGLSTCIHAKCISIQHITTFSLLLYSAREHAMTIPGQAQRGREAGREGGREGGRE